MDHLRALNHRRFSRRAFLSAAAASGAGVMASGLGSLALATPRRVADEDAPWFEATVPELRRLMRSREMSSRELTNAYLRRIEKLNPLLNAVIETNPDALGIAAQRDAERRRGDLRGPLHGIPVLLKDNIATADRMETTAGSLALVGSRGPGGCAAGQEAPSRRRRHPGQGQPVGVGQLPRLPPADFPFDTNFLNGWSGRGGFTLDPVPPVASTPAGRAPGLPSDRRPT